MADRGNLSERTQRCSETFLRTARTPSGLKSFRRDFLGSADACVLSFIHLRTALFIRLFGAVAKGIPVASRYSTRTVITLSRSTIGGWHRLPRAFVSICFRFLSLRSSTAESTTEMINLLFCINLHSGVCEYALEDCMPSFQCSPFRVTERSTIINTGTPVLVPILINPRSSPGFESPQTETWKACVPKELLRSSRRTLHPSNTVRREAPCRSSSELGVG
jgi:hypothetical protein